MYVNKTKETLLLGKVLVEVGAPLPADTSPDQIKSLLERGLISEGTADDGAGDTADISKLNKAELLALAKSKEEAKVNNIGGPEKIEELRTQLAGNADLEARGVTKAKLIGYLTALEGYADDSAEDDE
jgi:hypothetical protein